MEKPIRKTLMLLCIAAAVFLTACGGAAQPPAQAATSAPAVDENALRTQVAATVLAQLAQTPSATTAPQPTATAKPTSTTAPTATVAQTTPLASFTPGAGTPTVTLVNQAKYISQTVADGTSFKPGENFTMTWRIQNAGTSTWTDKYILRFFAGVSLGAPTEIPLPKEVKPGEMIDITLQMQAPLIAQEYTSSWVMSTPNRSNFKDPFYLTIKVVAPTKTPTLTKVPATATPTK